MSDFFESNKLLNLTKKKNKILHSNHSNKKPQSEFTSSFMNQSVSNAEGNSKTPSATSKSDSSSFN